MNYNFNGEELKINELLKVEKDLVYRNIEPEYLTADETIYHLRSKASIKIKYLDDNNNINDKEFNLYEEHKQDTVGWELDYDMCDFLDCQNETPEFKRSRDKIETFYDELKVNFNLKEEA